VSQQVPPGHVSPESPTVTTPTSKPILVGTSVLIAANAKDAASISAKWATPDVNLDRHVRAIGWGEEPDGEIDATD
jgi:hypothetical protein